MLPARSCGNFRAVGLARATHWLRACAGAFGVCAALVLSAPALAAGPLRPRVGGAFGIVPAHGHEFELATRGSVPVVYHGGVVMHGVTLHTVFWAPSGYGFDGPPGLLTRGYVDLIQQFFADIAHDSGGSGNEFSVLGAYPDAAGPAGYKIRYSPAADSVYATDPYPAPGRQCASPAGVATCVTDAEVQQELGRLGASGSLNDVWLVFLPPNVDECVEVGACGTNTFAGYHSLADLGRGPLVYAVVVDPLVEFTPGPGSDPEGNPEAERAIDTAGHELAESITDPEGTGWMDPNGFEVADKCEVGPQEGAPLGYGLDGSPYNQVIDGHPYLLQTMWSNQASGCVQRSAAAQGTPGLATVALAQFSARVSGSTGVPRRGIRVLVELVRAGRLVSAAAGATDAAGHWSVSLGPHALGDDRDVLEIAYGPGGPRPELIATGAGGNPFTESGFTGWFDLDHGYRVGADSVALAPCSQTGVLRLLVGRRPAPSPVEACQTEGDLAVVRTGRLRAGTPLSLTSVDDRAVSDRNPYGALVSLTVPLGEPGAVSPVSNEKIPFDPSGFPRCTAELEAQAVTCEGLIPGARYALSRRRGRAVRRARAGEGGAIRIAGLGITGGDLLTLRNRAGSTLTTLHVAHLRVDIAGQRTVISSGRCQPGDYWGPPITAPPLSAAVGVPGAAGTGTICPRSGRAGGLPAERIEQTDDFSGGVSRTEVPLLTSTSPSRGAAVYGPFIALARAGVRGRHGSFVPAPGATVALSVSPAGSGQVVFSAANVATPSGVRVGPLAPGVYEATWVVRDLNGDTRTVRSEFVEEP